MLITKSLQLQGSECADLHLQSHICPHSMGLKQARSGFGGLEVACWPLVPKFAGSNPAEAVGIFRAKKNPQRAFLRKGSKAVCPMSHICGMSKNPKLEVAAFGRNYRPFLAQVVPPFSTRFSGGDTWRCKQERLKTRVGTISLRLQCIRGHQPAGLYHITEHKQARERLHLSFGGVGT